MQTDEDRYGPAAGFADPAAGPVFSAEVFHRVRIGTAISGSILRIKRWLPGEYE